MIRVLDVKKRFGPVVALDGVTLSIEPGERVAFVGSNGSGKTTLLRALLGVVRVEGCVTIGGVDVAREPEVALRTVAYIPQIAPPVEAPVAELVRAHVALRDKSVDAVWSRAERLGLEPSSVRAKRFRDLSGGMKQKLLAAMALAVDAPILVCDEPTANRDGEARASFFEQLAERPKSAIVVLCSHRMEEVSHIVGRVVELSDGKVARDTSLADLMRELRAFRVELALRERGGDAEARVRACGLSPVGAGRFGIDLPQEQKVRLVTQLLGELGDDITDLSVTPIEEIGRTVSGDARDASAARVSRPRLEVVR